MSDIQEVIAESMPTVITENTAARDNTATEIRLDELGRLVNEIPDGTIYSADISEVISTGEESD